MCEESGSGGSASERSIPNAFAVEEGMELESQSVQRCEEAERAVFEEQNVRDVNELRDLVEGYRAQNEFLNKEIVLLHKMVRSLEERERGWQRQFAEVEGCYYQMKSRYLMVLNHFKSPEKPSISELYCLHLLVLASYRFYPWIYVKIATLNSCYLHNSLSYEIRFDLVMEPGMLQQLMAEVCRTSRDSLDKTDALGFYLKGRTEEGSSNGDLLDLAAECADKGAQSLEAARLEQSKENMLWLQSWDAFVVNWVGRPLVESQELKNLIRTGIPEAYRARVWKGLIQMTLKEKLSEFGNGYYSSMLRKTLFQQESGVYDTSIKQNPDFKIDLDLVRTLPANRMFADPDSEKVKQLRRVLYAYRNHDTLIGYCQGLNRIAAVALLYLDEEDAFWFLIAFTELQPPGYYASNLIGAVADQKALFRFALAILKMCEPAVLQSKTVSTVHACLSKPRQYVTDYKSLAQVDFNLFFLDVDISNLSLAVFIVCFI
ncbi:TBC domain protein [Ancylostoma ceylanicum]|uniref:TBC domain protein n=1 Tax=Ancylostoma ceylanicum TaxID=53326 RepID=A0A0D6LWA1_9BILA|nr:TBC domain protein [Ancylostoma ceylanicum]